MKNIKNCPICYSNNQSSFLSTSDFMLSKELFNIVKCEDCNFHFTNPIPQENEIGKYYKSEEYISHSSTKKNIIYLIYHLVRTITLKRKLKILSSLSNGKTILDYGAGTGHFLNLCKQNLFNIIGIEPDNDAKDYAKLNFNINLLSKDELYSLESSSIDFITMWHVLEHVYDFDKVVKQIYKILKNDAHWIVAVPNLNSYDAKCYKEYWAAYDLPRHIYHFQKSDMKLIAERFSFELIKEIPMKWDSYYVSMLSEKYKRGNIINAMKTALMSNLKAKKSGEYSSLIYVFKKV